MSARWQENREIAKRIVIEGTLTLLTPARFGGGSKSDPLTNMPLVRDPATNMPLLPGASIAGALRAYLRDWEMGYEKETPARVQKDFQRLFGHVVEGQGVTEREQESRESYLIIEDTCAKTANTEFRPGVKIDPKTRTAAMAKSEDEEADGKDNIQKGMLYDAELLEAGTEFPLRFVLALPDQDAKTNPGALQQALAIALLGLETGEISLGARKRRGLGECKVSNWQVQTYNLKDPKYLIAWLEGNEGQSAQGKTIAEMLGITINSNTDRRKRFNLSARFQLETSLLIRSGGTDPNAPDMIHLTSKRKEGNKPILSGTSLAGAVRARALRIANTVIPDETQARKLVADLFGPDEIKEKAKRGKAGKPWASRAMVREHIVKGRNDLVQTRIKIDRFTGGTYPGALFEQQPVFGGPGSEVCIEIELRKPDEAHIGLLLHVLKDLWTGDLPLGGEASVGRGRLKGVQANLTLRDPDQSEPETWVIANNGEDKLKIEGDREKLETYAKAVKQEAQNESENN